MMEFIASIVGIFLLSCATTLIAEHIDKIKSVMNLAKNGVKKSLDYTNQNTSKVRDYAIIVVCVVVIIALIAFFVG